METIQINIYQFNELGENAKKKALENHRENIYFMHVWSDINETIVQALKHFNATFDYNFIDFANPNLSSYAIKMDEEIAQISNLLLHDYLCFHHEPIIPIYQEKIVKLSEFSCPFTGTCYDDDFLKPYVEFMVKPVNITFKELLESCVRSLWKVMQNEYEYMFTEEYYNETCNANGIMFLEDGRAFN